MWGKNEKKYINVMYSYKVTKETEQKYTRKEEIKKQKISLPRRYRWKPNRL